MGFGLGDGCFLIKKIESVMLIGKLIKIKMVIVCMEFVCCRLLISNFIIVGRRRIFSILFMSVNLC